jgi:hypothetical protein
MPFKTYCFLTKLYGSQKSEINPSDRIWMIIPEESEIYQNSMKDQYDKIRDRGLIMTNQITHPDGSEWLLIMCSIIDIAVMITNDVLGIKNNDNRIICLEKLDGNTINKLKNYLKNVIGMCHDDNADIDEYDDDEEDTNERGSY